MARRVLANRKLSRRTTAAFHRKEWNLSARQLDWLIAAGLVLLTAVIYVQAVNFEFTNYDDTAYVPDNVHVRDGFSRDGIRWAFTTFETANWYPLTWLSLMLDCQLFGPRPGVHHLVNVLLHAVDVLLLYLVLLSMTGRRWPSTAVAALFAVHPLHVESVAWIAERKDVLSTLFFLLALVAYDHYAARRSVVRWSLLFLSMAVGLLCKPMLVTLPFVLLLLDYWPLGERAREQVGTEERERRTIRGRIGLLIAEKLPLLAISVAASVVTMKAQASQGATRMIGEKLDLPLQLANASLAYVKYLAMIFWPVNLAPFYPYDFHPRTAPVVASVALLIIITAVAMWLIRRAPYLAIGWFWYLGTLVPTIGVVQVGAQALADRYLYIPSIGLFVALVWGAADFYRRADRRSAAQERVAIAVASCAVIITLTVMAHRQASCWINSERLFRHALEVTGDNPVACESLGDALLHQDRFAEAERELRKVLELDAENFRQVPGELARAIAGQNRVGESIALLRDKIRDDEERAKAMNGLALFVAPRGYVAEAIQLLQEAIQLVPRQPAAVRNLAWIYATCPNKRFRNGPKAVELARRACELSDWSNADFRAVLADAYLEVGDRERAMGELRAARELSPHDSTIATRLKGMTGQ
jgi:protein O-mannosyl-transferase